MIEELNRYWYTVTSEYLSKRYSKEALQSYLKENTMDLADELYDQRDYYSLPILTTEELEKECIRCAESKDWLGCISRANALYGNETKYYKDKYWIYSGHPVLLQQEYLQKAIKEAIKKLEGN